MLAATEAQLGPLRHQLRDAARRLTGAKVLAERLYGVGPVTGLALTCWLAGKGRFSSSRKAVRFTGLDVTVWSSDRKGPPGRLSQQGPPVLRKPWWRCHWLLVADFAEIVRGVPVRHLMQDGRSAVHLSLARVAARTDGLLVTTEPGTAGIVP